MNPIQSVLMEINTILISYLLFIYITKKIWQHNEKKVK